MEDFEAGSGHEVQAGGGNTVMPGPRGDYDDEFIHYSQYVKPSGLCTARKASVRVSMEIKQVTCPGCMQQYIAEIPSPPQADWYDGR